MSLVIIVIGLILASVMKGKTVIEAARLRNMVAEVTTYKTAVNSFYAKYAALPGDFTEAESYWGTTAARNGDGNGKISFKNNDGIYEGYQAWEHLSNEQMVSVPFAGTQTTSVAELGVDVPKAKLGGGYFFDDADIAGFSGENLLIIGKPLASASRLALSSALTPSQAYQIDEKLDDGKPVTGNIRSEEGEEEAAGHCATTDTYTLSVERAACIAAFQF